MIELELQISNMQRDLPLEEQWITHPLIHSLLE